MPRASPEFGRAGARRVRVSGATLATVEIRPATIRDLAHHLHAQGHTTWASATTAPAASKAQV
ncbi:hypothetical protein [Embleya sp. NBC_00896]|uniref:hypothetical protein n=1 Tax=Embleya sp. NBC_00896 TaxID=2975961 RepID=UPI0038701965|nr:hypothetical protein OG928_01065 [Embleya sp. NBC_00896]